MAKSKKTLDDILNKYTVEKGTGAKNSPFLSSSKTTKTSNKPASIKTSNKAVSSKTEKREQNNSSASSLDEILNKYNPNTLKKPTFSAKVSTTKDTTKKHTDFNTETRNALSSAKDKVYSKTSIESGMSEREREDRIKAINSELTTLNAKLSGYSRASVYGTNNAMKEAKKRDEERIAELKQELKTLKRVGTFSASELKQFEIDDAKEKVSSARQKVNSYGARPSLDSAESYKSAVSEQYKAQQELDQLKRQKELYDDIADFGVVTHSDDFLGQWRANYRSNELSREADKAFNEYIMNPTEENKQIAYAYDAFSKAYMQNNEKALDDENVKASWLTKSAAGYLPQLKDQILPEAIGYVAGGILGTAVGAPTAGASIGAGIGTFAQSYGVMQGSVYRTLLAEGVDEETARQAAQDEALISSLIEGGETALSVLAMGGTKAFSAIGNAAKASVAKGSTNAATKFVANIATKATAKAATKAVAEVSKPLWKKGLGMAVGVAGQGISEYLEEFTQGGVSEANRERALSGNADGKWQLAKDSAGVVWDAITGKDPDTLKELHAQGVEGAKIGLMFGGTTATVNNIVTHYANAKTVKLQNEIADTIINDEESLNALIEEGKASGEGTVSAKIAEEVEQAKENGTVTRDQVKKLITSNETYIKAEEATAPATLEEAARDVVEEKTFKTYRMNSIMGDGERSVGVADGQAYVTNSKDILPSLANRSVFLPVNDTEAAKSEFGATESSKTSANISKILASDFVPVRDNSVDGAIEGVGEVRIFTDENGREIALETNVAEYFEGYNLEATFRGGKPYAIKATDNDGNIAGVAMAVWNDRSGEKYKLIDVADVKKSNVPYNVMSNENPLLQERSAREAYIERATGYGQYGVRAFADIMETISESEAPIVAKAFQTAYEAGLTNLDTAQATLPTEVHRIAFNAGKQDFIMENVGKVKNVKNVKSHGDKAGFDSTNVRSDVSKQAVKIFDRFCKELGVKAYMVGDSYSYNANITPNVGAVQIANNFNVLEHLGEDAVSLSFVTHGLHEVASHRAEELAPVEFAEFKREMYNYKNSLKGVSLADTKRQSYGERGVDISLSDAMSEITSNSLLELYDNDLNLLAEGLDRVLNGTNAKAKKGANVFKQALDYVIKKFNEFLEKIGITESFTFKYKASSDEIIRLRDLFENALSAAIAKNKEIAKTSLVTEKNGTIIDANGNVVAQINEDGTATFSLKTFDDSGRAELKKWLDKNVNSKKITEAEAKDISEQLEYFYDICKQYEDKYAPFSAWSKAEVVKGLDGKPLMSVVKANGDYKMNLDFSLVCKKRRPLDALYRAMIDDGFMDDIGQLSEVEVASINEIIRKNGFETACTLCFVDSKRYRQYAVADAFVSKYNELVKMLAPEGAKIDRFDFSGKREASADGLHTMSNEELKSGINKLNKVIKEHGESTVVGKIAKHLKAVAKDRKLVMVSDFMDSEGFVRVKKANPEVFKLYNSSKGSGGPKATLPDVQYLGEILKKSNFTPKNAYAVGGVRVQSFSDYIPRLVFDYLQMTADLSAKKLPAHAYSKEDIFVMQFGKTGIKINMSLVPAVAKDGIAAGLDKDGNYVWVDGHTFASDFHDKGSGQRGFELAVKIQNTEGYSQNCGTIAVGVSDEHIIKMLKDNDIRMVIPYHKSSLNHFVAKMGNIDQYKDYTNVQNTRDRATGKKIEGKDFNFNEAFHRLGDAKEATKEYLAWCEKNNYLPKFDAFAFHEDAEVRENYYKVLIDFAAYDSEGNATPQGAVTMNFPTENDAFGSMKSLIKKGLEADAILEGRKEKQIPEILKEVKAALSETRETIELSDVKTKYSLREKEPPKKTGIAYKVFYAEDGKLYPPMVANPNGEGTPVGVWLDADIGKSAPDTKTGRPQVQSGGKGTNASKGSLAFRPGWHLGDVPHATQFARKNPETGVKDLFPADFVWAECEYAMDVDYQEEAMSYGYTENGKFRHSYAGLPKLPTDGYYRYRTNPKPDTVPWIITGAMKVNRILTDAETDAICRENGIELMKRQGGELDLSKYGLEAGETAQKNTDLTGGGVKFSLKNKNLTIKSMIPFTKLDGYIAVAQDDEVALESLESAVEGIKRGTYTNDATGYRAKITSDTINKALYPTHKPFDKYAENHILNLNAMLKLPELFKKAVYVDSKPPQKTKNKNKAIKEYHHFVAPLRVGKDTYRALITAREKKNSNTLYVLNVEVLPIQKKAHPVAAQLKAGGSQYGGVPSNISIPELVNGVKILNYDTGITDVYSGKDIKFSLKDSEGNTLSKEQTDFFNASKARNGEGNLLALYHGSRSEAFSIFDMKKGVWLAEDQRYSEVYASQWHSWRDDYPETASRRTDINGLEPEVYADEDYRVYKVYADIQNPLDIGEIDGYLSDGKVGALARALGVRYSELKAISDNYMEEPTYMLTRSEEFIELARNKGFDGFKATEKGRNTWCAIQSADQIKLTTNKKPTRNPDTRYSLKDSYSTEGMTESDIENAHNVISALKTYAMSSKYLDGFAAYTTERMEREIADSSSKTEIDFASSYITWVEPIDFVYATTTSEQTRQALREEAGTLNIEKLKGEIQPIHLTVNFETGEIIGHEGRHRMLALQQEGIDKVAIIIDALNDDRHHTKPIEFMSLKGQRFEYRKGVDMYLHNMLPLSKRYADTARALFTTKPKSGIQYSLKGTERDISLRDVPKVRKAIADKNAEVLAKYVDSGAISTEVYNQLIEEFGAIPTGEKPYRDVTVPKKTAKNKKVSQTVRTILEARVTPDEAVPTIEKMVEDGVFSYDVYTDKQAIADAESYIKEYGWDESLDDWFDAVNKGEVSKDLTVTGWALYNNAANIAATSTSESERQSATKTALKILDAMVRHQRSAAQALQATRVLKKLSPETQLYGVQKSVQAFQKELTEKYGDKAPDLQIDGDLAEQFLNAKTEEERAAIEEEIYKDIGRQMPSRFVDKWNAWRYLAMLGNPRTHIRNILGNAGFAPIVGVKNLTATAIESAVYLVSGKKMIRGKSIVWGSKADRALLKAAWNDYGNVADLISNGGKYNDFAMANQKIEEGRRIFKFKPLEWARKGNSALLEAEDMWFSKPHYAFALAQYCKANNITAEQIERGKAIAPAREYAIKEAQKATYRDTNAFSQMVSEWGRKKNEKNVVKKAFNTVVEGILPFRKTPANILVRGVEYSPLGLLKGLSYDLVQVGKGKMMATEAIDNISAGLTGTGLLALGVYLAAQGLIRGHGEDDKDEKEFKEMMGHQAYSLELPNGESITLDWLAPEALPFFVGVNVWEASKGSEEELNLSAILQSVSRISEPMLEMSCLQGLNDLFENVGYASSNNTSGLVSVVSSAVTSYLSQGIPTLFGQIERTGEEERMTTYTEKDAFLTGDVQYTLGKASAKIPYWDYNQIPYIDAWGRKEASGSKLKRGLNNFLNPAYTSTIETSKMEEELLRLYEITGEGSVFPSRADKKFTVDGEDKHLTADEYVRYATLKGEKSYNLVSDLVNSQAYKKLSDEEKVKAIEEAYDYANQKAKEAISNYKPETWVTKADEFGSNVGNYISFKTEVSGTRESNGGKISKQEVLDIILDTAQSDSETWKMYLSEYDSKKDIAIHNAGIGAEEYMTVIQNVDKYDQPNKSGNLGTYTNEEIAIAIRMTDGLANREKAILWQEMTGSTSTKNNPWRKYLP